MNIKLFTFYRFVVAVTFVALLPLVPAFAKDSDFRTRPNRLVTNYTEKDILEEIKFGRHLAGKILKKYPLVKNPKLQRYVSTLGAALAAQYGRENLVYLFGIIKSNEVNAYACPGGYILLTQGALDMMSNEAQLVTVLAHEIAHINQRHVVKELKIKARDKSFSSGLTSLAGGATSTARVALGQLSEKAFKLLFEEGLHKKDELESDQLGLEMAVGLGYNPAEYIKYLGKISGISANQKIKTLSKTHPSPKTRIDKLNQWLKTNEIEQEGINQQGRFRSYTKG